MGDLPVEPCLSLSRVQLRPTRESARMRVGPALG